VGASRPALPAAHFSGAPSYSLRVKVEEKVFVYSGDTQWTDTLIEASEQADLFVCESYVFDNEVALHNNYRAITQHRERLTCKRVVLTHMSEEMLARAAEVELPMADAIFWTGDKISISASEDQRSARRRSFPPIAGRTSDSVLVRGGTLERLGFSEVMGAVNLPDRRGNPHTHDDVPEGRCR
jgi:hypothetical protein